MEGREGREREESSGGRYLARLPPRLGLGWGGVVEGGGGPTPTARSAVPRLRGPSRGVVFAVK